MLNLVFEKEYKRSPSLIWDISVLIFWLIVLSALTYAGATSGFNKSFDIGFFTKRMAPIYSLFGTVCLAYEFFTAIRNESNKNRLNQQLIKAMGYRDAAVAAIINESDRKKRINELNIQIKIYESDLEHEMRYVRRKYFIAWFGIFLVVLSTFLQLPTA